MTQVGEPAIVTDPRRDHLQQARAWDARVAQALDHAPAWLSRRVAWLRHPTRRWIRLPAGVALVCGGLLSILPILGLWMLPLGLALLAEDSPRLKSGLERVAVRIEALWRRFRR